MIGQLNINGIDKVETAIKRFQTFEPPEGYYLCFSGGKDSVVIKALADMAGVKYDAHYSLTSVDHPELVRFIKEVHPDVKFEIPRYKDGTQITMWNLIPKKQVPPTMWTRYCCKNLKESSGEGRFVVTGVRWAESARRAKIRAGLEIDNGTKWRNREDPDNPENAKMARFCPTKGHHILNPIIDWENSDVWEFINTYKIPYCKLYDQGYKRLGCIGCPMDTKQAEELEKYPKYKQAYLKAFDKMLKERKKTGKKDTRWRTPEDVMDWWIGGKA